MALNVSKAKLASVAFDNDLYATLMVLLSIGAKGGKSFVIALAVKLRKEEKYASMTKVQNLKFSTGWFYKFKQRHGLTNRKGDNKKLGKVPGPDAIDASQRDFQFKTSGRVHRALMFAGDETMTRNFEQNQNTLAPRGAKDVFLSSAADEKGGHTSHFWISAGRVDGLGGGQFMPQLSIFQGISSTSVFNIMKELAGFDGDLRLILKVNPEPDLVTERGTARPYIGLDDLRPDLMTTPPTKWLRNFLFSMPIPHRLGCRISKKGAFSLPVRTFVCCVCVCSFILILL